MNLVEKMVADLRNEITQGLEKAKDAGKISFLEAPAFIMEVPNDKAHGDFASNVALMLTKQAKMKPRDIAQVIVDSLDLTMGLIERVEIAGPGFINFYLKKQWVYDILPIVEAEDTKFGFSNAGGGKKVQVEFVSANPTGLLHMGNARGGALGDSLSNLLKMAGYEVSKEYYINDAGNQIVKLGKSLEARYYQALGQVDYPFPEDGYHGADITETAEKIISEVGDLYLSLPEDERLEKMIATALTEKITGIKKGLSAFGVLYDEWFSELSLHESGAIDEVLAILKEREMVYEKEGALWLKTTSFGDEKDEVLVRSNGIPTYFAADIAYHKNKFDRGFDWVINIWGADHHGHVARLKGAMNALGYDGEKLTIILMQLVRLYQNNEIVKMSKRTGQFVTLEELIEEVGKDAARYFFVMRNPDSHLDFDMDLAKAQSSDNPVYYVQYAHARICSILSATGQELPKAGEIDLSVLVKPAELDLLRKIADLPSEIAQAAEELAPYRMARYATDLATMFHSFYNSCRVLTDDEPLKEARIVLVNATRISLRNVLVLLGITAPERM